MYERPRVNVKVERVSGFAFAPLASATSEEASLCCGEAGEKKKRERAGHDWKGKERRAFSRLFPLPIVPRALSIFFDYCYFIGIPSGSLCGGESVHAIPFTLGYQGGKWWRKSITTDIIPGLQMFSLCGISFLANRAQIQVKYPTKKK